jgi:hypothetical protein
MLTSVHFQPWEVAPGLDTDLQWDNPVAWSLPIDQRILDLADQIRSILGVPCLINDYKAGRHFCGIRTPRCPEYSPTSWHSVTSAHLCGAVDLHPVGMSADDARSIIRKAAGLGAVPLLGGMELGVNWCHIDIRKRVDGAVVEFRA